MAASSTQIAGSTSAQDAARDWQAVRDAGDIQFAPLPPATVPKPPAWLEALGKFMEDLLEPLGRILGLSWPVVQIILIALAALLALYILWRIAVPMIARWRARPPVEAPQWAPDQAAAVALLSDADLLAAQGRYGEAAHLLLQRSVHHIAEAQPGWLHPANTAREIAALPMLPARARTAFGAIAVRVERSLFALRPLDAADWQAARNAYADFALAELAL